MTDPQPVEEQWNSGAIPKSPKEKAGRRRVSRRTPRAVYSAPSGDQQNVQFSAMPRLNHALSCLFHTLQ
ncbi:Mitochondrial glycine transporter [Clarias magur]|uniref:Mitochondrial glycine transporter n=1 Tax=Clarias magur TaxID=1594786 RepID=A0A8J4UMB0_CLAMG|nr:Mitochondrial glycine transporter [Clarias magur]